jgi:ketosteroid isomerase-like protein
MLTGRVDLIRLLQRASFAAGAAAWVMTTALVVPIARAGGANMPATLADAVNAYRQATMRNDIATLSRLVADDYVLVNSDGSVQAKPSYLDDFRRPGFRIERYVVDQPAQMVWGETALVRSRLHLTWTQDGETHDRVVRIAHVWTRRAGHWQIAYTQLTRVAER